MTSTPFRPWLLVGVFSLLLFLITAATYSSLGVVIPAMVPELGWSWEHAFLGFTILGVFTGLSSWLPALLIRRIGVLPVMGTGLLLNLACVAVALSGVDLHQFVIALFLLGIGWNFLFTGATTLSLTTFTAEEKDRAQGALNFCMFATLALTSFASGVLVTTQGWRLLNFGSLVPLALTGIALVWLARRRTSPAIA